MKQGQKYSKNMVLPNKSINSDSNNDLLWAPADNLGANILVKTKLHGTISEQVTMLSEDQLIQYIRVNLLLDTIKYIRVPGFVSGYVVLGWVNCIYCNKPTALVLALVE